MDFLQHGASIIQFYISLLRCRIGILHKCHVKYVEYAIKKRDYVYSNWIACREEDERDVKKTTKVKLF